ncbi:hypothetical protein BKA56DRAFT_356320 [Ilyonectria sp. MPI-CAGE-AT-0026]|nr:hypothetical protein BKA56DRAFT_356320 [Ilyonectria sp. MPI-CAGE-AT-0026]
MPGGGISRQGSTAFPTTIRKRNQPDEFSSSPVLRILSTPRSPLLKALRSAKSMHNETEIIHLIRLAEDKITQLTESAKQSTTQEKTQRKGVQAIQKALDEGIRRKEKLEDEMGKTADFFAHGGPSAEMQSLHNRIRKIAERLGAQNEQNNRLKQEKDVRGQWLRSATTQAAQMNNVILSFNELLGWLKTRKQQGMWLNAELEDAEESEPAFTPLSEMRLLAAPDSAKSTPADIADAPGVGGGRMSARSSHVGPVQDAPAVEISSLEPDVPGMNLFWRIVVDQFLAWKEMYAFGRDLGWETLRYLNAIDKAEDIQMEPFKPPPFPWEGMITVAYHLQLAATLEVYVASQRQRDIWMSANGLTRDYMIQSHREPPAWMFIPGVDEDLILRGRDVRRLIVWVIGLLYTATSSIWDFLLWAVEASTVWVWQQLLSRL